jgi:prefoldin subunit 5
MNTRILRQTAFTVFAALAGLTAVSSCTAPADEEVIEDIQIQMDALKDELDKLRASLYGLTDTTDELQKTSKKHEEWITKSGAGAQTSADYSTQIRELGTAVKALQDSAAQTNAALKNLGQSRPAARSASGQAAAKPAGGATAATRPSAPRGVEEPPIKPNGFYYLVKTGDTFASIAADAGISEEKLRADNNTGADRTLLEGQRIWVTAPRPAGR